MKKALIIFVVMVFVFSNLPILSYASAINNKTGLDNIVNVGFSKEKKNGSTIITSEYVNKETGQLDKLVIIENEKVRHVKHYVENKIVDQTKLIKNSGKLVITDSDGKVTIRNKSDFVTIIDSEDSYNEKVKKQSNYMIPYVYEDPYGPSEYTFVKTGYNSAWGEYGSLYKKDVVKDYEFYRVEFGTGTLITTAIAVIDLIFTKGALRGIFLILGYTFLESGLNAYFAGTVDARRIERTYRVYSQSELGLETSKYIVEAVITDQYGVTAYPEEFDGGDSRTEDEIIDAGIYNVVMWNS